MTGKAITPANTGRAGVRPPEDLYETLADCTIPLLETLPFPHKIWECACGRGAIAEIFRCAGHRVIATDLYDHGYGRAGVDFLKTRRLRARAIVTNPPFGHSDPLDERFVRHALGLGADLVVMFMRFNFLAAITRNDIINAQLRATHNLTHVFVVVPRPTLKPVNVILKNTGAMDYAWFVWQRGARGPAIVEQLRRYGK